MVTKTIYLDYNATTPLDPRVFSAMEPFFKDQFGNPASVSHSYGWTAKAAVDNARKKIATSLGVKPKSIYWTSGATESNNMAILGLLRPFLRRQEPCHFITSSVEHKAVLDVARAIEKEGAEVSIIAPDKEGFVRPESIKSALRPHTRLVSIIMGQNEIGAINPIAEIGELLSEESAKNQPIYLHSDAAQNFGKTAIDMLSMKIDLLSGSGHKIYGPKGVGFLAMSSLKTPPQMEPLLFGGAQEDGLRPGTLNVPGIVGMGEACALAVADMQEESNRLAEMRDSFIDKVLKNIPEATLNGPRQKRMPNNISLSFKGLSPDDFALGLSGLAYSSASACSGGDISHVLKAIGLPEDLSRATIRIGIGRFTEPTDLDLAYEKILQMIKKRRSISNI